MRTHLYEVWVSRGDGMRPGPRFRLLSDATRYVDEHDDGASLAVRAPDGRWELIVSRHGSVYSM